MHVELRVLRWGRSPADQAAPSIPGWDDSHGTGGSPLDFDRDLSRGDVEAPAERDPRSIAGADPADRVEVLAGFNRTPQNPGEGSHPSPRGEPFPDSPHEPAHSREGNPHHEKSQREPGKDRSNVDVFPMDQGDKAHQQQSY